MSIPPVQTRYAGCHFRSRIEARWAIVFDQLGVPWEYEPEGFELRGNWDDIGDFWDRSGAFDLGRYLPDFWLPSIETWFEVKGVKPTDEENTKASALAAITGKRHITAYGEIPRPDDVGYSGMPYDMSDSMLLDGGMDIHYSFCVCPWCGKVGIEFDGRGARVCGWQAHVKLTEDEAKEIAHGQGHWRIDDKCYSASDPRILAAFEAGRSARFEFGETPERPDGLA